MDERFDAGMKVRREVLGDAHVDASLDAATDFTRDIQEIVTRNCWGDIWTRTGLSREERSLINLAMISALNRPHEFKVHVRGALRNGVSVDKIKEVLLQVGFYAGGPAALDAFRLAAEVVAQEEKSA